MEQGHHAALPARCPGLPQRVAVRPRVGAVTSVGRAMPGMTCRPPHPPAERRLFPSANRFRMSRNVAFRRPNTLAVAGDRPANQRRARSGNAERFQWPTNSPRSHWRVRENLRAGDAAIARCARPSMMAMRFADLERLPSEVVTAKDEKLGVLCSRSCKIEQFIAAVGPDQRVERGKRPSSINRIGASVAKARAGPQRLPAMPPKARPRERSAHPTAHRSSAGDRRGPAPRPALQKLQSKADIRAPCARAARPNCWIQPRPRRPAGAFATARGAAVTFTHVAAHAHLDHGRAPRG